MILTIDTDKVGVPAAIVFAALLVAAAVLLVGRDDVAAAPAPAKVAAAPSAGCVAR